MKLEDSRVSSTAEIKKKKNYIFIKRFRNLGFRDLRFVKFQFPIISLVRFCNHSLFFLNLKYMLDIKGI